MKKTLLLATLIITLFTIASCDDADVASHNLSKAADNFEVERRIIFYNGITDKYMFTMEGRCSIYSDNDDKQLEVTCKIGEDEFQKHYLGLSDNVTYIVEHLGTTDASEYHYRITFKPEVIVPDIERE